MYFKKIPQAIQSFYPQYIWRIPNVAKKIYLTFDDGPCAELTNYILSTLEAYQAKATFFCLGKQIKLHPELFQNILKQDHAIGSHGYNHISGWTSTLDAYIDDFEKASEYLKSNLFRPPYGRMKTEQASYILKDHKIVMWDVMPGDFDTKISPEQCYQNTIRNASDGSIIVLHDNPSSSQTIQELLPKVLDYYSALDYEFCPLSIM